MTFQITLNGLTKLKKNKIYDKTSFLFVFRRKWRNIEKGEKLQKEKFLLKVFLPKNLIKSFIYQRN